MISILVWKGGLIAFKEDGCAVSFIDIVLLTSGSIGLKREKEKSRE